MAHAILPQLFKMLNVKHITTSVANPKANGLLERQHRTIKAALALSAKDSQWCDRLPLVMLTLRNTSKILIYHRHRLFLVKILFYHQN